MTTKKETASKAKPAVKTAKKSVVAPASTLNEKPVNSGAPRNTATFAPPEPSVLSQRITADSDALRTMQDDTAAAIKEGMPKEPVGTAGDTMASQPVVNNTVTAEPQPAPAGIDPAIAQALMQALANGPQPVQPPTAPVYSPKLVTPGVVKFLHVLKDIDVAEFDQKLDDLTVLLQARAQSRTENARRLQNMTLAMHIYQEFDFLWPQGSQAVPRQ